MDRFPRKMEHTFLAIAQQRPGGTRFLRGVVRRHARWVGRAVMRKIAGCTGYDIDVHSNSSTGLDASTATAPQVIAWICHLLTDWMGDDSFLHHLDIEIFSMPRLGSTTVITGVVDRESASRDEQCTKINVVAKCQDGSTVATGFALVLQPKSDQSKICLPHER